MTSMEYKMNININLFSNNKINFVCYVFVISTAYVVLFRKYRRKPVEMTMRYATCPHNYAPLFYPEHMV